MNQSTAVCHGEKKNNRSTKTVEILENSVKWSKTKSNNHCKVSGHILKWMYCIHERILTKKNDY